MERIYGIDLGTTNSEIAWVEGGRAELIEIENGMKVLPSAVGIDPSGRMVTGVAARNQYAAFPENTVLSIKRRMGSGETVRLGGREYTPAEVSAEILKRLKRAAEERHGGPVEKAVITVPAYFTDLQRRDTLRAGELAGLEVVRIINEPTAAALAYGARREKREKILVYDLGGGTFDVSLIEVEEGVLEVAATDGDTRLGGDDFDRLLLEDLVAGLPEGAVPPDDLRARARLKNVAEAAKVRLSTTTVADIREEFIAVREGRPVHLERRVTRQEYESLIEGTLDETFELVERVLETAKVPKEEIDKVLLVGGSTYTPLVFNTLRERGFDVHREVDPTFCVAIGAALQGAIIAGEELDTILVDVNSHSLGVRTIHMGLVDMNDDHYSIVIHRNTAIPTSMTRTYYTMMPGQRAVEIEAYQGENPIASRNTPIGSFRLEDLPPRLPVDSEIDVTFEYNLNGVVEVSARERSSGRSRKIEVDVNRLEERPGEPPEAPPGEKE